MPKFAIAFVTPTKEGVLKHRIIESADRDSALKLFFNEDVCEYYSPDEQGYHYFKEDFFDTAVNNGSILECE